MQQHSLKALTHNSIQSTYSAALYSTFYNLFTTYLQLIYNDLIRPLHHYRVTATIPLQGTVSRASTPARVSIT